MPVPHVSSRLQDIGTVGLLCLWVQPWVWWLCLVGGHDLGLKTVTHVRLGETARMVMQLAFLFMSVTM